MSAHQRPVIPADFPEFWAGPPKPAPGSTTETTPNGRACIVTGQKAMSADFPSLQSSLTNAPGAGEALLQLSRRLFIDGIGLGPDALLQLALNQGNLIVPVSSVGSYDIPTCELIGLAAGAGLQLSFNRGASLEDLALEIESKQAVLFIANTGVLLDRPAQVGVVEANGILIATAVVRDRETGEIVGFYVFGNAPEPIFADASAMLNAWLEVGGLWIGVSNRKYGNP